MADYTLWGLDPAGYHLTNALLHALNAGLAYVVTVRLAASRPVALLTALLFAVHPVNVENVAWVAERKTLLSTAFLLGAFLAWLGWREKPTRRRYAAAFVLFAAAVLAKASTIILPLLLATHDLILRPMASRLRLALLPFFVLAFAGGAATAFGHAGGGNIESAAVSANVLLGVVYPTATVIFWKYVGLLVWPAELNALYDTALHRSFLALPVLAALAGWVAVTAAVFRFGGRQGRFWYLWFWICLLPMSNLVPLNTYYADRYLYLPAVGVFTLAGLGGQALVERLPDLRLLVRIVAGAVIIALGLLAFRRQEVWRDEVVFWQDTVRKSPALYKPHLNLGVAYEMRGRLAEAEREYLVAFRIWPSREAAANLMTVRRRLPGQSGGAP
jgi:hypothetical protein